MRGSLTKEVSFTWDGVHKPKAVEGMHFLWGYVWLTNQRQRRGKPSGCTNLPGRLPLVVQRSASHKKKKSNVTMNTTTSQKLLLTENVELKNKCVDILRGLQTHEHGWVFATPVDPVELELDDYFEIIKKPMDLGTIQETLDAGSYHSFEDFASDVRLTFQNAMKYNGEGSIVHKMAMELKNKFEVESKKPFVRQPYKEYAASENSKKVHADVSDDEEME
jgi:hypothetical protein